MDTKGGTGGGMNWEIGIDIYMSLGMKQITSEDLLCSNGELYSVLCGDLDEREIQKGGDMCIHMAGSLHCAAEASITL